ncbi:MAG: hypothetical protein C4519_18840 [Desulfobacteraceae bacterium]|nr:MAG: hypothetical protein C4519_18840 [Desulfobacteraceae bacterium]
MGAVIRYIGPDARCPKYKAWLQQVVAAGREGGEQAAEEYMRNNPYVGLITLALGLVGSWARRCLREAGKQGIDD